MSGSIIITQSNYIPWKGYFDAIALTDEFIVYDEMQYTKRDWRNRNLIKTAQGLKWLTIPVEVKGKYYQKISETKISDANWFKSHWDTIAHNYAKTAYFKEYSEYFKQVYYTATHAYLTEINIHFLEKICSFLNINFNYKNSSAFDLTEDKTQRLVDICKSLSVTDYYTGPSAKQYMDEEKFNKENIKVHYFNYSEYPEYNQLHPPFEHGVTILDLIFNEGSNAVKYMKYAGKKENII